MDTDQKKTEINVLELLQDRPSTRNSDWLLLLFYLKRHHGVKVILRDLYGASVPVSALPSFESITRARRKIQLEKTIGGAYLRPNLLPTDPEVMRQRRIKQGVLQSHYSHYNQGGIL